MATFFVIALCIVERPAVLIKEYMADEISVHTWSHHPLIPFTNEQIVAELSWTRKAIQSVIGVMSMTTRPSFGDINDHVR